MKKINFDILIKIVLLILLSMFFITLIISKRILIYVHPRIIPFAIVSSILMLIIAFFQIPLIFTTTRKKIKIRNYIFYLVPILILLLVPLNTIPAPAQDVQKESPKPKNNNLDNYDGPKIEIVDNTLNITPKNYVSALDDILNNPDKYDNCTITITGFIYKDETFKPDEYLIARNLMICCVADMQLAGIKFVKADFSMPSDTWVKITGKISKPKNPNEDPVIIPDKIEKDANPDTSYVYPY